MLSMLVAAGYPVNVGGGSYPCWSHVEEPQQVMVSDAAASRLNTRLFLGPAMSSPAKCALTAASCEVLLKAHVRNIDGGQFLNEDVEVVITNYLPFLTACACQTTRLSSSVVAQAAVQVLGVSTAVSSTFGQPMSSALSYCYQKGLKATSGKRLSDGVRAIWLSFRGDHFATCLSPKAKDGDKGSSKSSSSSCSLVPVADPATPPGAAASRSSSSSSTTTSTSTSTTRSSTRNGRQAHHL